MSKSQNVYKYNRLDFSNIEERLRPHVDNSDEEKLDPRFITPNEIEEYFEISKCNMMNDMYYRMKERCESSYTGLFKNPENSAMADFFEIIKNNVDIRSYYKRENKV